MCVLILSLKHFSIENMQINYESLNSRIFFAYQGSGRYIEDTTRGNSLGESNG